MGRPKKTPAEETSGGFKKVPSDLNLWPPDEVKKGEQLVGLVTYVNPAGKFGLQVKVMEPSGEIFTLASHKVLQGRLEGVPGGLRPMKTVLRITYTGKEKGKTWPTPMEMYDLEYRERAKEDLWDVGEVV